MLAAPDQPNQTGREAASSPSLPCPNCMAVNPPNYLFCQRCGSLLPRTTPFDGTPLGVTSAAVRLSPVLLPISIDLVRAGRATLYDSASILAALATVDAAARRLDELRRSPDLGPPEEFVWERNAELAECSSLIEGAGALLGLATAAETRDGLRGLFVRRAYWVLRVASARTRALLEQGER